MHRLMESISFCPLFGKPCAERHPLDQSVKAEMALDERRSAAAVARHEQERRQSTSIPMPSSSSSSLTSSSTSSHQLHHHHNQEQGQEQNLPLHSPPCHPVVHHHHRDRAAEEQLQCYPLSSPRRQFHLIVSSSFKSHLDSMSACGQRTCSPVIKNFSSTCSDPTETTARLLISSEWDDLVSERRETDVSPVIPLPHTRPSSPSSSILFPHPPRH